MDEKTENQIPENQVNSAQNPSDTERQFTANAAENNGGESPENIGENISQNGQEFSPENGAENPMNSAQPVNEMPWQDGELKQAEQPVVLATDFEKPQGKNQKGYRLFLGIFAAIILMCVCVAGGYYLGNNGNGGIFVKGKKVKVDLASKPESANAMSGAEIYSAVTPSVVGIYVYNEKDIASSATGVVYRDGYIITNDHIYDGVANPKFKIYTSNGEAYDAQYVAGDTRSDLAVLKTNATNLKAATFGDSEELVIGETVVAIGCPNGASEAATFSQGCVSALNRRLSITTSYTCKFIQTDSAINPGNSGGALCNLYGQIVGITSAKLADEVYDNVGFAIPTTTMKQVVDSLIANGYVKGRAKLGISYYNNVALASEITKTKAGLQIATISDESPLKGKAEVKDVITKVNGIEISSANVLLDILEQKKSGDTVTFTIYSATAKTYKDFTVTLLEDKGESSYNKTSSDKNSNNFNNYFGNFGNDKQNDDNNKKEEYNQSQFSFPNGD